MVCCLFITNSIEGVKSSIKGISKYFGGINFNIIQNFDDDAIRDYLEDGLLWHSSLGIVN